MQRISRSALIVVVLSFACAGPSVDSDDPELPGAYDLYSTILTELADSAWYAPILVQTVTWSRPTDSLAMDFLGPVSDFVGEAAASAFDDANRRSVTLVDSFDIAAGVEIVSPLHERIQEAGGAFWSAIRREHGENVVVIRFSRPGIDLAAGEAVVYFAFYCGPSMCAQGELVRFVRSDQGWIIDRKELAWVS